MKEVGNNVPQAFCTLIEMSLSKMVATNVLEPDYNSADFWKAFSRKFTSAQSYEVRKRRTESELASYYKCLRNYVKYYVN